MQRDAIKNLILWKDSFSRKPLVVYGMRQVGKTWLIKEFGSRQYKNTAYVSFDNNQTAKNIFSKDFDIARIIQELEILTNMKILPQETLIIFDEVQECPLALTSLKYFYENAPQYHIISAGSLLGVMSFEGTGFPVGKVDIMTLYPMTFLEFLTALGKEKLADIVKDNHFSAINTFGPELTQLLKQYFFVGGMPSAVKTYAANNNFSDVRHEQEIILNGYYADFAKHIPSKEIAKVKLIWDSAPVQLGKENKRFLYSDMKEGSRGREYETALKWLEDAGLLHKINRVSLPNIPLVSYKEQNIFKLYLADIGLLSARTNMSAKTYLESDSQFFTHYKGILAEQFVLQELRAANRSLPIYYWATDKNIAEVEFVIQYENKIIPIEVKSGKNIKSESLKHYIEKFNPDIAVRTSLSQYQKNKTISDIPLYLIGNVANIVGKPQI